MSKKTALTSSFRKIITSGSLYIDKTRDIYNFLAQAAADDAYFFLARPRRFGKSLLVSTLKELFEGNRELFKGLWIDSSDYTWSQHPVILLNFSTFDSSSPEKLEESLAIRLNIEARRHGLTISEGSTPIDKLVLLVEALANINRVVILIDEYDYPLISNINNAELVEENRKVLSNFFTAIKGLDEQLKALFITGVSQIPKASIFSGLNIPNNISLDPIAATLFGYTKEEILTHFSEDITKLAQSEKKSFDEILNEIQVWYNGYRFSEIEVKVYNPFSLHYLFTKKKFANYWYSTATPTFLLKLLKKHNYLLENVEGSVFSLEGLQTMTLENPQLGPLLFQTGYLTVGSYDKENNKYLLAYPNQEVKQSYALSLAEAITNKNEDKLSPLITSFKDALLTNQTELLCQTISALFAHVPYQIKEKDDTSEAFFHRTFQILVTLSGLKSCSEFSTNKGRIDMLIETPLYIYIFELKAHISAEAALKQIEAKAYHERFVNSEGVLKTKTIILVGLSFTKKGETATVTCKSLIKKQ